MGRCLNGEGSIYQRTDGRWAGVITTNEGERKFVYGKTKKEAAKKLQLANQEKAQGTLITAKDQKLSAFLTQWLTDTAQPNVRAKTYLRFTYTLCQH